MKYTICRACGGSGRDNPEGQELRILRLESSRTLSMSKLAKSIGVSVPFLSQVENGVRHVPDRILTAYLERFS